MFSSLKRHFPNTPDWVVGGLIVVIVLWLVVLPTEALAAITGQDFLGPSSSVWLIRSLYFLGFSTSMALISPWTRSQFTFDNLRLVVVALGLLIVSPIYFVMGALLSMRKAIARTLGILILMITIIMGFLVTVATLFMAD
jgi:hypothetical protein